jgi:hypothetical protein
MKYLVFIASIAIFMLVSSCTNENEVLNSNDIDQKKSFSRSIVKIDGEEIPYLTFDDFDDISVGDTICNFHEIEVDESIRPANMRSSSGNSDNSALNELVDFPLNIIVRESNSSARYLTNQGLNAELCLANYDANNNVKQTFYLKPRMNQFSIETPVHRFLTSFQRFPVSVGYDTNNPGVTVVFVSDGTGGLPGAPIGATWDIYPSQRVLGENGAYIFSVGYGLLYMQSEGTKIRMGNNYVMKGTQEFEIRPIDEFEMVSLELITDGSSCAVRKPDFVDNWDYNNNTDADQDMSTNFTRKAVRTSSFSREHSVSFNISTSLKVGGAVLVGGSISLTASNANKWTYGQTEQSEDTRTYNFPIRIPKRTRVQTTLYVAQYELNLTYRAVLRGKTTGKYFTEIGKWEGVDCTTIKVDAQATDVHGNTETQSFSGVPTSRVIFSQLTSSQTLIKDKILQKELILQKDKILLP